MRPRTHENLKIQYLQTMKESFYTYRLEENGYLFLYNAATDQMMALLPQVAALYKSAANRPESLAERHPALYDSLCSGGFLVADDADEPAAFIASLEERERADRSFGIIVNPTLRCNLRCWYCYEKHDHLTDMPLAVREAVCRLVDRVAADGRHDRLNLSFFGGEPLLPFADVVRPILRHTADVCARHGLTATYHFTTNASLLDDALIDELAPYGASFQITLDGNEAVHDRVKRTEAGEPTYHTVVSHIRRALARGLYVTVRFNYTARFLSSFIDVLADFKDCNETERRLLSFDFQRVWQDNAGNPDEVNARVAEMATRFEEAGFRAGAEPTHLTPFCYADSRNHVVVNYDGRLFKCTARDFTPERAEGRLLPDGRIETNERYARRMDVRAGNAACRACRVFPLCHGGCSQMKLEYEGTGCLKGYSEERKEEMLRGRLLYVAEKTRDARRREQQKNTERP